MRKKIKIISVDGIKVFPVNTNPQAYTTPFSIRSQKWYDELSDSDPYNPSCPHLHSVGGPYKMDVYTGQIYNTQTKKIIEGYHIREKDLKKLWNDKKFVAFALAMRKLYSDKFPNGALPEIPEYCGIQDKIETKLKRNIHKRSDIYVKIKIPVTRL